MSVAPLRIGTRGSELALWQARHVAARLAVLGVATELVVVKTAGDRITELPLSQVPGKAFFTKELEEALLAGEVDLAVHSLKDVATALPAGLALGAVLEREDPRDALISASATRIEDLPPRARFGTSSVRRQAMLLNRRPDLNIVPLRGNVDTRLSRVESGDMDATILAIAGLKRLGKQAVAKATIATTDMLPAVAQGAIGIECRQRDEALIECLSRINHAETLMAVTLEREFLTVLDGSCKTPIGGYARRSEQGRMTFEGCALSPDGRTRHDVARHDSARTVDEARAIGRSAGEELLARAGRSFFQV